MYDLFMYYDLFYIEPKIPIGLSSKHRLRAGSNINHIATSQKCQLQKHVRPVASTARTDGKTRKQT